MFKVYFTNHMYWADCAFDTARDALAFMRRSGFQCSAHLEGWGAVFSYCPLAGLRTYHGRYDFLYRDPR